MNQTLHVNKTNFHMKGFALGLALKQRRKSTRKSPKLLEITTKNTPEPPRGILRLTVEWYLPARDKRSIGELVAG